MFSTGGGGKRKPSDNNRKSFQEAKGTKASPTAKKLKKKKSANDVSAQSGLPANGERDLNNETVASTEQVIEYLVKKGYNRTEQTLRTESSNLDKDGRPIPLPAEDGPEKYARGFALLLNWIEGSLDLYKPELRRLLWPLFIYSWIDLVMNNHTSEAENFLKQFGSHFEKIHSDHLRLFETIKLPQHILENETARLYHKEKYQLAINQTAYFALATFLDANHDKGGTIALYIISTYLTITKTKRDPLNMFSFEAIVNQARNTVLEDVEEAEGIPGVFTGVINKDIGSEMKELKLGLLAMEPELAGDVRADLEDIDAKETPVAGRPSLVEVFDKTIKREDSADAPSRTEIPYPPSRARDVVMEVQKIRENRDRFKIEGRTGGVGPGVSVCLFTFHNTLDSITCIEFSDDNKLVAVGTEESYIRVWDMAGDILTSIVKPKDNDPPPSSSRRLIGHSASVYAVSFSPSIARADDATEDVPQTSPKLLVSCSSDRHIRLWSLETWTCLIVYKGHDGPIWNVRFSPFGHYFVSCGWDKTARIWAQDHISPLRLLVGHDSSVMQVAWHPNGAYVFTSSDAVDKTVRMWSFATGECVRVFVGHLESATTLECSPSGKILASGDASGTIFLWDLASGTLIKKCRGHGKGGIWSLSFSVESTVLCSGGADGTVRVWDVQVPSDSNKPDGEIVGIGGQIDATRINAAPAGTQSGASGSGGSKKKGKDTTITPDQINAFPTKKTPVYKVQFTRMNLILAGGCYLP